MNNNKYFAIQQTNKTNADNVNEYNNVGGWVYAHIFQAPQGQV